MATSNVVVTVAQVKPLLVVADGASTACPVTAPAGDSYAVGDRVQVTVRTPQPPLMVGKADAI